jgi:L-methionine (R)-S-oxide reductase
MAEQLVINKTNKATTYASLLPQIKALCEGEDNLIANLANISAALKEAFDFFWVGFYLVTEQEDLVLGPFQGPIACTRISKGKGVCGTAWEQMQTLVVPNVEEFPGHIACSALSKSEIVVPIIKSGNVVGVLDVDSDELNTFDAEDQQALTNLCQWISSDLM